MRLDTNKEPLDVNNSRARGRARAGARRPELSAWNRVNGFAGSMGCRTSELSGPVELASIAARMFGVDPNGSLEQIADRIEALGCTGRRVAAMSYIERNHPEPDVLFPETAKGRRPSKKIAQAMALATSREGRENALLEASATDIIVEARRRDRAVPGLVASLVTLPRETRAKARHKLNRLAERKMKAGEQLTREETKEVERRVRQRAFRRAKAAKNAQAATRP